MTQASRLVASLGAVEPYAFVACWLDAIAAGHDVRGVGGARVAQSGAASTATDASRHAAVPLAARAPALRARSPRPVTCAAVGGVSSSSTR